MREAGSGLPHYPGPRPLDAGRSFCAKEWTGPLPEAGPVCWEDRPPRKRAGPIEVYGVAAADLTLSASLGFQESVGISGAQSAAPNTMA